MASDVEEDGRVGSDAGSDVEGIEGSRVMRRSGVLLVVLLAVAAVTPAAFAGGDGKGALIAGFNGGLGGGSAVLEHNSNAAGHSAVSIGQYNGVFGTVPEGRIVSFLPDQVRCDHLVIGTWLTLFDSTENKSDFELFTVDVFLDGEPLAVTSTPVKAFLRESDEKQVAANYGVPVIGQLEVGDYNLVTDFYIDGDLEVSFDIIFTVEDC